VNAALLISSVDKTAKDSTVSALIAAYLRLQNIDENSYPAFEAVVRSRINAAMEALKELATSGSYAANDEWLTLALREMRDDAEAWRIMSGHINSWLQYFSLDPAVGLFKRDDEGKEKYDEKLAEREELLATRIGDLSVKRIPGHPSNRHFPTIRIPGHPSNRHFPTTRHAICP